VLQCVAVYCSVLHCDLLLLAKLLHNGRSVLQCVADCVAVSCSVSMGEVCGSALQIVLQCVAVCCSVLHCDLLLLAELLHNGRSVLQCVADRVAACCSVLQCIELCCIATCFFSLNCATVGRILCEVCCSVLKITLQCVALC